jgi:hypothetical protein
MAGFLGRLVGGGRVGGVGLGDGACWMVRAGLGTEVGTGVGAAGGAGGGRKGATGWLVLAGAGWRLPVAIDNVGDIGWKEGVECCHMGTPPKQNASATTSRVVLFRMLWEGDGSYCVCIPSAGT